MRNSLSRRVRRPGWRDRAPGRILPLLNGAGLVTVLVVVIAVHPHRAPLRTGMVADETIVADRQVRYVDRQATALHKRQAADAVPVVYHPDTTLAQHRLAELTSFLSRVQPVFNGSDQNARLSAIQRLAPSDIPSTDWASLAALSPTDLQVVQAVGPGVLGQAISWRFNETQIGTTAIGLLATVPHRVTSAQRLALSTILQAFLAPTEVPDLVATREQQQAAMNRVAPVRATVYPGEVVIRRGDLVTPTVMSELTALDVQGRQGGAVILASIVFTSITVAMLFWFLVVFQPAVVANPRMLVLIDTSIVVAVAATQILAAGHILLPLFLPVAAASTFGAVLMAPEACIAMTLAIGLLAGWVVSNSLELTVYYFLSGTAGVLAVLGMRRLQRFLVAGGLIAAFAFLTLLAFALVNGGYDGAAFQEYALAALFNGGASAVLALGAFALIAGYLGVTTPLHLLELGQPTQPLLRRLIVKAPGTYNHSLIVSTMVERAAEEVGADALGVKVAALYHDVGKMTNPLAFIENQLGGANIHDELRPEESARIIRGHVTSGLRMARQHNLPRSVLAGIAEHHGTLTIPYFLHRAREESGGDPVDLALYRYPGPKPQSKETALLMLADGSESAVRASSDHSPDGIAAVVDRMFRDRMENGQLDECPLTLADVQRARDAFCSVLNGLYHPRIDYPEGEPARVAREI